MDRDTTREALEVSVAKYLKSHRRSKGTDARDRSSLRIFDAWREKAKAPDGFPVEPLVVVLFALAVYSGRALPNGRPPSPAYFRNLMDAITRAHIDGGAVPPTMDPGVRAVRTTIEHKLSSMRKPHRAAPFTPEDGIKLSEIRFDPNFEVARKRAASLLALESTATMRQIYGLDRSSIQGDASHVRLDFPPTKIGPVKAPQVSLTIRCLQSPDCAHACTLCALRALDRLVPEAGRKLFAFKMGRLGTVDTVDFDDTESRDRGVKTLRLTVVNLITKAAVPATLTSGGHIAWTTDEVQVRRAAVSRLGIVGDPSLLAFTRDRALMLTAFHNGLRSGEVRTMRRDQLRKTPGEILVHPGVRKNAQDGDSDQLSVIHANDPRLCAVRALTTWLDLYDSITASSDLDRGGLVFCPVHNGLIKGDKPMSYEALNVRLRILSTQAGLKRRLTGHSFRRGFAQFAWETLGDTALPQILATMALRSPEIFTSYVEGGAAERKTVGLLFENPALTGDSPEESDPPETT